MSHRRTGRTPRWVRSVTVAATVALAGSLTAGHPAAATLGATTTTVGVATAAQQQALALPSASVVDLATGRTVDLRSVSRGRPMVLWFWAPG